MAEYKIPSQVSEILEKLEQAKFEAFLVGGCVRDLLMGRAVADWDVATNAKPEEIQKIFPDSFYENEFGTVGVKNDEIGVIEVTPYRKETNYSDKRHPDSVKFTASLEEDLARRDFTINAMAMAATSDKQQATRVIDPFGGQKDIKSKTIRAVGDPVERFGEDALRLMRAVRFASQLDFKIEQGTEEAIKEKAETLKAISKERASDEFLKIINSQDAEKGIRDLQRLGLLKHIIPELEEGIGVEQGKHHKWDVFEHSVRSLGYAAKFGYGTASRLAALLHDIAKPRTRRQEASRRGAAPNYTFYGHEVVGARMAAKIMDRLRLPKKLAEKVVTLVRYHMFYYDVGEVKEASVRRLVRKVGPENIKELIETRIAERKGSGVPKAEPYRLRHLQYMMEKVQKDPLTVGMLKVGGEDVMKILDLEPGLKVGLVLNALLEEVLDDPKKNSNKYLGTRIKELGKLSDSELKKLAEGGKGKLEEKREEIDKKIKGKYYVR